MPVHRPLRPGFLPAAMIFLFITAFDPWPTEARADDGADCVERAAALETTSLIAVARHPLSCPIVR